MSTRQNALVIDDEASIRRLLKVALGADGTEVLEAASGTEGLALAAQWQPKYILLDLGLPDLDGNLVLLKLREWYTYPIIILSVRTNEEQIVTALDNGADDYVCKPFNTAELRARIRAACRHRGKEVNDESIYSSGNLRIDFSKRQVFVKSEEVRLTQTEYDVLRFFVAHEGRVVTYSQILVAIWGPNAKHHNHYLRVYVNHIRQKIEANGEDRKFIVTEPRVGYRFIAASKSEM